MTAFEPLAYGSACAELLRNLPPCELGPGQPQRAVRAELAALDDQLVFGEQAVVDRDMAACCRAGLWLRHNFLDESHKISQSIETSSGSYWHGIMHRREPDFSNSKYWFRRVGEHAIFAVLGAAAGKHIAELATWDPFAFVDRCEAAIRRGGASETACRAIATLEWQMLFDYCYCQAVGK